MLAQSIRRSVLTSWNPIPKRSTTGPWTAWFALSLIFITPNFNAFAKCGGSGGCSSGSCSSGSGSSGVGSQFSTDRKINQASSSLYGESMQNQMGLSEFPPLPPTMGPHGGIISSLQQHQAEVVFTPQETRVYLYSATGEPLTVRGVQGEVSMKIRNIPKIYRFALQEASDARDQSFLLLKVNASQVQDGDMEVTFELNRLPSQNEPRARFVQTFALTQPAVFTSKETEPRKTIEVHQVATTVADRPLMDRQKICPITNEPLGSMGAPVKLMVDDQPLLLCCEGCIEQVKNNPTAYLNISKN